MGSRLSREVEDFVSAFKSGASVGYQMRYMRYLEQQQQLKLMEMRGREQRKSGIPSYEQDLINQGEKSRFGPRSDNDLQSSPVKQATVQPKKAEIPDATPTAKAASTTSSDGATPQGKSGGSSGGGEQHSSITDKYPGSYQTAALETGTMNDASPVRGGYGVPAPQSGATPKLAHFDASKAPSYLDAIAQKHGIDPTDFKRMAWIESKFDPNARASGSSAGGLFQFTDDTARAYKLSNKFDGVANAEAAAQLWNDNKAGLTKALGRAPTAGELYLAHQQGLGGATALLTNPNGSAAAAVGAKAVTNNGGRAGMSAREFSNMWTGRFDNIGNEAGATPRSSGNAPATPSGNQAVNTRQRTAADASSMSDANNDVRRTGGITQAVPADTTPKSSGAKYSSGADLEGKTFKEAYNESIKSAQPAATTQASTTPTYLTDAQVLEAVRKGEHINYDSAGRAISTSSGEMATSGNPDAVQKAAPTEAPEFPNTAGQETPKPPTRPEDLQQGPKPAVEPLQPASQPTADASAQQGGFDFLDQLGQGFDQLGADIQSFFSDLNVPSDWDVGSSAGADMGGDFGGGDFGGGDFGGGDFFGGIGGALGGLFNRGGMVR